MKEALLLTLREGGWILWALLLLAVMIYTSMAQSWHECLHTGRRVRQKVWHSHTRPDLAREAVTFELEAVSRLRRRLPFLSVMIAAAPLLGLLGTVSGMLLTFDGMRQGGLAKPLDTISAGISQALITTQAGLAVAIPASILIAFLWQRTQLLSLEIERQFHAFAAQNTPTPAQP